MVCLRTRDSLKVSQLSRLFPGKQWHDNKTAFRPRANQTSWDKRTAERKALAAIKAKEKELKEEKEAERQVRLRATS
jgi:rRNA-processing protein CGR1